MASLVSMLLDHSFGIVVIGSKGSFSNRGQDYSCLIFSAVIAHVLSMFIFVACSNIIKIFS